MRVHVSTKGQIVLPADIRRKYGIEAGSELGLVEWAGALYLVPIGTDNPLDELQGFTKGVEGFSSRFLADRRAEREREEADLSRWPRS